MEIIDLKKRYMSVEGALEDLAETIDINANGPGGEIYNKHMRKAEIKSFEFTIDTFWKLLKDYLLYAYKMNIDVPTPKRIFRESLNVGFLTQDEFDTLLDAVDARNKTSHTYHEELAEEIVQQVPGFYTLMFNFQGV